MRRRDPATLGPEHVTAFLNALATRRRVAASTPESALAALLFLNHDVLGVELPWLDDLVHPRSPGRLPVVLTREEVRAVLAQMDGLPRLMATLFYGCGLHFLECCRLRVKDMGFGRNQITVRRGKGQGPRDDAAGIPEARTHRAHRARARPDPAFRRLRYDQEAVKKARSGRMFSPARLVAIAVLLATTPSAGGGPAPCDNYDSERSWASEPHGIR